MNTYKIIQSKIITRNSPKIEKTLTVGELKQHLKKTIPYAKVPVETLQAYNLVGNRHEKRAKIHKYAQQIGNTYADIMQKLNAEENISSYDLQNFANGINFLVENKQKITPNMITTLEKATKNVANQIDFLLENPNQNIEPNMINALARGIDSLTQQNQNQNIDPSLLNTLAREIDSLLLKKETKDFSYELKILSQGTLTLISNDYSIDNLKTLYSTLQSLHTKINKNASIEELPTITPAEGKTYLDTIDQQSATYGKSQEVSDNDPKKLLCYERNSGEICNFRLSYTSISGLFNTCHEDNETHLQTENKGILRKKIQEEAKIKLLKLKTPAMFKDDVSFDKIMQEYAYKEQEEVGVKNSDIRIVENDIVFFTHQYDKLKVLNQKPEDYELPGNPEIMVQTGSKVEIANNNKNITKLNELISILKPQCHENSYACLTHLVHRAIQRYGNINGGGYDLDKTISSVKELLKLKDTILNSSRKQVNIKDINTIIRDINSLSSRKYDIEKTQNIINSLSLFLDNIDDEDTKTEIQEQIEKLKIIQCINSEPSASTYANKINKIVKNIKKEIVKNIKKEIREFLEAKPESKEEKVALDKIPVDMSNECIKIKEQYIQSVKKHEKLEKECNEYKNKYGFNGDVADIKKLKEELVGKLKEYAKKQFTLSYSNQGNKYNYKAYELKTELGTLIIDNKGKISTIINTTI